MCMGSTNCMNKMLLILVITGLIFLSYGENNACSSGLCKCSNHRVLCKRLNLTYIPVLPLDARELIMDVNYFPVINSKTFQNISHTKVEYLSMFNCSIRTIERSSFQYVTFLATLDLSYNNLTVQSLYNLMANLQFKKNFSNFQSLRLRLISLRSLPKGLFQGNIRLKQLDLSANNLTALNFRELSPLRQLDYLHIGYNQISSITNLQPMYQLKYLLLSNNKLAKLPNLCSDSGLFPRLEKLSLNHNIICSYIPDYLNCLHSLQNLTLRKNCISHIKTDSFHGLKSLQQLDLFGQSRWSKDHLQRFAFNNSNLEILNLDNSGIKVDAIHIEALKGLTNLKFLTISGSSLNDHDDTTCNRIDQILSPLSSLTKLSMINANLYSIPASIKKMENLFSIFLMKNNIISWPADFWQNNKKLKELLISNNQMKTMKREMFPPSFRNQLKYISLGYNHVECECENVWFIEWIRQNTSFFHDYPRGYTCLNMTERVCLKNIPLYSSLTGVCSILLIIFIILSLVYKYRWFLKYQIYLWCHQPKILVNMAQRQYLYDVFVSYSAKDGIWVRNYLIPNLEENENIKLCIHERDFLAGRMIIDNIVEAMESSRRVLIVLSNNFAESEWCQFELTLAQKHVLNLYIEPLTVVLLEEINTENMSNSLQALLQTTTYITWSDEEANIHLFWQRLKNSLINQL